MARSSAWLLMIFSMLLSTVPACQGASEDTGMPVSIQDVKAKYQDELMARPGVVSVGVGRDDEGNPAIIVGLDGPRSETVNTLPKELEGYSVRVEVVGSIKAR